MRDSKLLTPSDAVRGEKAARGSLNLAAGILASDLLPSVREESGLRDWSGIVGALCKQPEARMQTTELMDAPTCHRHARV